MGQSDFHHKNKTCLTIENLFTKITTKPCRFLEDVQVVTNESNSFQVFVLHADHTLRQQDDDTVCVINPEGSVTIQIGICEPPSTKWFFDVKDRLVSVNPSDIEKFKCLQNVDGILSMNRCSSTSTHPWTISKLNIKQADDFQIRNIMFNISQRLYLISTVPGIPIVSTTRPYPTYTNPEIKNPTKPKQPFT